MYQAYGPEPEEDCATGKSGKSGPTAPSAGKSGKSGPTSPSMGKSGKSARPWLEDSAPSATGGKSGKSGPTAPSAGKSGKSGSYSPNSYGKSGKSGSKCQKPDPGECVSSPPVAEEGACCASTDCDGYTDPLDTSPCK